MDNTSLCPSTCQVNHNIQPLCDPWAVIGSPKSHVQCKAHNCHHGAESNCLKLSGMRTLTRDFPVGGALGKSYGWGLMFLKHP